MKFEFKERESRSFYDEILFVAAYYKKIINNKYKKVTKLSTYMIKNIIISLLLIIVIGFYYYKTMNKLNFFMLGILIAIVLYCIYYLIFIKKRIDAFVNYKGKMTITINDKKIEYKDENNSFKADWDQIAFILVSKYSICFIPKTRENAMITLNSENKDKLISVLEKYNKKDLLVDNSGRYK